MPRWHYRSEAVELGGNSVQVRAFTSGERKRFFDLSQKARTGAMSPAELPELIAKMVCVDITDEDLDSMPIDLLQACVDKAIELSGMGRVVGGADDGAPAGADTEKKATTPSSS